MAHFHWRYKNIILLALSLLVAALIAQTATFHAWLLSLGGFSYLGIFIAGMLFAITFTALPSTVVLLSLATLINPWQVALIGALGAALTDFFVFHVVQSHVGSEVKAWAGVKKHAHLWRLFHTKYFNWVLLILGAAIIASPLPDDLGISLLGLTKIKTYQLVILSLISNTIVILSLVLVGHKLYV